MLPVALCLVLCLPLLANAGAIFNNRNRRQETPAQAAIIITATQVVTAVHTDVQTHTVQVSKTTTLGQSSSSLTSTTSSVSSSSASASQTEFSVSFLPPPSSASPSPTPKVIDEISIGLVPNPTTSPVPPLASSSPAASPSPSSKPLVAAYYADWTADDLAPENIDFTRFDWIDFAFGIPDKNQNVGFSQDDSAQLLDRLVTAAHSHGSKVKLSIGGWTDSGHFSTCVSTSTTRQTFVTNIVNLYHQHNLDGIDIDWEYPGENGASGNTQSPSDTANFLTFLQLLRTSLPPNAKISAAAQVWPFADSNGDPLKDASAFAKVLDWVLIMNYDIWGSSSNPGPNAPLSNACENSTQPLANAVSAVKSWTAANFPANQLLLGIPSYGYVSISSATHLVQRGLTHARATNPVTVLDDDGQDNGGQVQFASLISQGALQKDDTGHYVGAGSFQRYWDECSSTPFLRSQVAGQVITYDDPDSIRMKAAFAKSAGILGVNMFDAHGDTIQWELIDAAREGLDLI
ncbi:glycoside hydrolase [Sistotremastrum niveocremeum HHB9708]|uniref:Glycoside hydrolase n=2 Tax=Sistotremastraceae TaxID=3402574 RepID=A0A164ZE74_9AGAM|nr:glycoside hydrolase [Sistotremastrum niveocremeum HHB9708]KZT39674.1 glycoside hydrolase [Sistotremastrum suecicum HHB10207 ss-3]